ncbi:PREDICTED: tumor-associated calcium signal transducer 2-like [Cyprinodon variegatus]|uniref:tumor-associated calcium signal transducer 2-like n=1 Tax=Cyprinodon variegatus TaxID=28743 RepID=UPI0007426904|nr:PREDICTED: tumor-associated calcium signal transducer 2-like [Cyprinodon variegatus]
MRGFILLSLAVFAAVATVDSCGVCETMKWATCEENSGNCECKLQLDTTVKQLINCKKLVPKCFLMKAEMQRARVGLSVRSIAGKPVETAFVDNDGIYDPECENDGKFKAKQCNRTEECWCVNSVGVRRTDVGDKNIQCPKLVETYWIRVQLKHKEIKTTLNEDKLKETMGNYISSRYQFDKKLIDTIQYDPDGRFIVMDVKKEKGERNTDLGNMAYYLEKDFKVLPLFFDESLVSPQVDGQKLEMEKVVVYYVDEEAPTFTMKNLSGGIIAVIVVVVLLVVLGLVALFLLNRRKLNSKNRGRNDNL